MSITQATPYGLKIATDDGRRVHQHRALAERVVGHRLGSRVQVHHVDGDKTNYANRNLVICEDAAYHQLLHARTLVVKAGGNPNTERFCTQCRLAKPYADFYPRRDRPCGFSPTCKSCHGARYQARRGPQKVSRLYKLASSEIQKQMFELRDRGHSQRQIASAVGVRQCSVSAFFQRAANGSTR